jgi:hypothetical protein
VDDALLDRLADELRRRAPGRRGAPAVDQGLHRASVRLIPVSQVAYLRSDEKYTLVAWAGGEALIRKTIRELADELDPQAFVQVHRSDHRQPAPCGAGPCAAPTRRPTCTCSQGPAPEVLPVSRSYLHLFRQM